MANPSPLIVEQALADPQRFRAWLARQDQRQFRACTPCDCPLSAYLTAVSPFGQPCVSVRPTFAAWSEGDPHLTYARTAPLPRWAARFVEAIDDLAGPAPQRSIRANQLVSAPEALRILDEVLAAAEVSA